MLNNYIQIVTDKVSMLDVLEKYGYSLNRHKEMLCPFHNEKTPSFTVFADNKRFKCFGCGEQGSVIDFVEKIEDLDFYNALQKLNDDFGCGIDFGRRISQRERNEMTKKSLRLKREREKRQKAEKIIDDVYFQACADLDYWSKAKNRYEPDSAMFEIIAEKITELNYLIDFIEIERSEQFVRARANT